MSFLNAVLEERKYYKPKSLTWWAGIIMIASGVMQANGWTIPVVTEIIRPLIETTQGASDPSSKIMFGFGFIGMRGAFPVREAIST